MIESDFTSKWYSQAYLLLVFRSPLFVQRQPRTAILPITAGRTSALKMLYLGSCEIASDCLSRVQANVINHPFVKTRMSCLDYKDLGCRLPILHGQLQILGLFRNAWLRCSAAEEEILEVPYKMRCMPDEAVLKHNRDMKCLERQTSAAMFDVIAPIPFVSIEQERSQRYKLSLVENSFVVVQACAREE